MTRHNLVVFVLVNGGVLGKPVVKFLFVRCRDAVRDINKAQKSSMLIVFLSVETSFFAMSLNRLMVASFTPNDEKRL